MDRYTKLRTTSGTTNIHQQSSPLGDHKYRGDHYHKENKTNVGKQIEFSAEGNKLEKKSKESLTAAEYKIENCLVVDSFQDFCKVPLKRMVDSIF